MENNSCDFSLGHYQRIISIIKDNYKIRFFCDKPKNFGNQVYLRHDIDLDIDQAVIMAELETEAKIHATYFIQLTSCFYNPLSLENRKKINHISKLGHKLGLHFDHQSLEIGGRGEKDEVAIQFRCLSDFFEMENVVSFHRPPKETIGVERDLGHGVVNVYSSQFFQSEHLEYISDSGGIWKAGCACKRIESLDKNKNVQLLIHPIWWGSGFNDPNKTLQLYLQGGMRQLDGNLAKNIKTYENNS